MFDHQDRLSRLADPVRLLDEVLAPLEGSRLDQVLYRRGGGYQPAAAQLRLEPGLGLGVPVLQAALPVVLELDGERPLCELVASAAAGTGFDVAEVSRQSLTGARRLVALGLVEWRHA